MVCSVASTVISKPCSAAGGRGGRADGRHQRRDGAGTDFGYEALDGGRRCEHHTVGGSHGLSLFVAQRSGHVAVGGHVEHLPARGSQPVGQH